MHKTQSGICSVILNKIKAMSLSSWEKKSKKEFSLSYVASY